MIEGKRRAILLRAKGQVIFYMINLISIFNGLQITDQRDAMIFTPEGILHGYILILFLSIKYNQLLLIKNPTVISPIKYSLGSR